MSSLSAGSGAASAGAAAGGAAPKAEEKKEESEEEIVAGFGFDDDSDWVSYYLLFDCEQIEEEMCNVGLS